MVEADLGELLNGVDGNSDFVFFEAEHAGQDGSGFDFIGRVAFRISHDSEHGSDDFVFNGFGVGGLSFLHTVDDFAPLFGGFHAGSGGLSGIVGALVDELISLGEVALVLIPVAPDGVIALISLGHAFDFLLSELFDLFSDVHS